MRCAISVLLFFSLLIHLSAQNVGVGTSAPSEKLEVEGLIFTNQGGVKFPDSTIQTTAYPGMQGDSNVVIRQYAVLTATGLSGSFNGLGITNGVLILSEHQKITAIAAGGGGGGGIVVGFDDLSISRNVDDLSYYFFDAAVKGTIIAEVGISFIQETMSGSSIYTQIQLKNARFSLYEQDFRYSEDLNAYAHIEQINMSYNTIALISIGPGGPICVCYDVENNVASNCGCP